MAIFSKKTKVKEEDKKEVIETATVNTESKSKKTSNRSLEHVIRHPRVTEKANNTTAQNAYIFDVDPRANKVDISKAIESLYKVVPVKVNTLKVPSKTVFYKGKKGVKSGGKKAIIYLKKGDSIEIV